ncbi:MAG TPA: carboxypeptidase regulatory-like domain-containing protein [Acidobacteriaceae bacterium]|nr:carboxypeptidase regulatory-like domain-containing protein [Acidobacteriaceae bacterium]
MSGLMRNAGVRWMLGLAMLLGSACAWGTEYHGQVFVNGTPVPGATVRVSQGGKEFSAVTDEQGVYAFADLSDGTWKIEIRMRGFETLKGEVTVSPNAPQGKFDLTLLSMEQMLAEVKEVQPAGPPALEARAPQKPSAATQAPAAEPPSADENDDQAADGLLVNGSDNNAATSKYSLSPAFGNRRPGTRGLYTGGFASAVGNSAFDARPYSLTGFQVPKAAYSRVVVGATLGGPLMIPHLFYHGPSFFVAYQWTRDSAGSIDPALMPDSAERSGDLSGLTNALGQPLTIYNPATGQPFAGPIPVSPQAQAMLRLYPLPNIGDTPGYNYEAEVLSHSHSDALQSRLDKTLGRRDQVYGGFGFQSMRADAANVFSFVDTTDTLGLDAHVNWSHQYNHGIFAVLGYHFTRQRTLLRPEFENKQNISGEAGITGNDQNPQDWGPPSLNFSSGTEALSDANGEFNRNRTDAFSLKLSTTRRRHTITGGGDYREQEFNEFTESNPRGTFAFTGAATAAPGSAGASPGGASTSGSDLADFLLGIPDTSALAFGNPEKYFRQPAYDVYVVDDFRVNPELTVNAGMRWEYGAPMTELYGRMVNLDITTDFAAAAPVVARDPTGSLTGTRYPAALVRPDRRGFEPRVGVSWRPIPASTMVVRVGYGVYDDTSIYLSSAQTMAQQAPLSKSLTVANSSSCPLTLANGFIACAGFTADTYAVDPNLRVGYAQDWQLSVQSDLPGALVATVTYSGVKGTRGMQQFLPNTWPVGTANPCPSCPTGFVYRTSNGNSTREAGEVNLRRRLRGGLTASVDYVWSKSLDDDAVIGAQGHATTQASMSAPSDTNASASAGGSPTIAQNWLDLNAERGLSTFDQRNLVTATLQYTTGMGLTETLLSGRRGRWFKEWTLLAKTTAGSGLPETPNLVEAVPGTGVTGPIRPDVTGAPLYQGSGGHFLNAAAYTAPASGAWGDARRDSVIGPDVFTFDSSMARTFRLRGTRSLDVRVDATNPLNHVTYTAWDTTVNSTTFGLPALSNPMRSLQITGRLRF